MSACGDFAPNLSGAESNKMSAEAFESTQPLVRQTTELSDQLGGNEDVNTGIYIPSSQPQVISRNADSRNRSGSDSSYRRERSHSPRRQSSQEDGAQPCEPRLLDGPATGAVVRSRYSTPSRVPRVEPAAGAIAANDRRIPPRPHCLERPRKRETPRGAQRRRGGVKCSPKLNRG